jgi:type IV secretory pathway component VirB8
VSTIPNSAMPHARAEPAPAPEPASRKQQLQQAVGSARQWASEHLRSPREALRNVPTVAVAATGATLFVAAATVAALLPRRRRKGSVLSG